MGWRDEHYYDFILHGLQFGDPEQDDFDDPSVIDKVLDATKITLSQAVNTERDGFTYLYDSGDDWYHKITLVSILPIEPKLTYPFCLTGEGACPPENVGGILGYYSMLEDLQQGNAESSRHLSWLKSCGYHDFGPLAFDIEETNQTLAKLFNSQRR